MRAASHGRHQHAQLGGAEARPAHAAVALSVDGRCRRGGWEGVWRGQMVEREGLLWEGARSERRGALRARDCVEATVAMSRFTGVQW